MTATAPSLAHAYRKVNQSGTFCAQIPTWVPLVTPIDSKPLDILSTRSLNTDQEKRKLRSE